MHRALPPAPVAKFRSVVALGSAVAPAPFVYLVVAVAAPAYLAAGLAYPARSAVALDFAAAPGSADSADSAGLAVVVAIGAEVWYRHS